MSGQQSRVERLNRSLDQRPTGSGSRAGLEQIKVCLDRIHVGEREALHNDRCQYRTQQSECEG
eukprot:2368891-Rhodomonas_salina.2